MHMWPIHYTGILSQTLITNILSQASKLTQTQLRSIQTDTAAVVVFSVCLKKKHEVINNQYISHTKRVAQLVECSSTNGK